MKGRIFFALIGLSIAAASQAQAQLDPNRTVMIVNGEEIKGAEYYGRLELLPNVGTSINGKFAEAPPGFLALQRLIEERLLMALAKEKGVYPTDAEVQDVIKERIEDDPQYMDKLTALGYTVKDVSYQIIMDLSEFKLTTQGITITDQEVEKFYKDNPTMFLTPKNYKLKVIAVETDGAKALVEAELKKGTLFGDVAKKYSMDASKFKSGDVGRIAESNFSDAVKKALQATKIGLHTEWIKGENTSVMFLVEGINPESTVPLDAKLKRNLRRKIMLDRGRVKTDLAKDMRAMRAKAVIDVKQPQFAQAIKEYMENAKLGG